MSDGIGKLKLTSGKTGLKVREEKELIMSEVWKVGKKAIQKEKELHSNHKNEIGSDYYPVEGDIGFPPWLRLKYQNLKISRRNDGDDDLTITYS